MAARLVYVDNSALNRPFDDQMQQRIRDETYALSRIIGAIGQGELELVASDWSHYENDNGRDALRRGWVRSVLTMARVTHPTSRDVRERGLELVARGLGLIDALHVASAEAASATDFVTCDDQLLRRYVGPLRAKNPIEFVADVMPE